MLRILVSLVLSVGLFAALGSVERTAAPAADDPPEQLIATFSIAAVDPESGVCGAAVASKYPAVGKVVAHARADAVPSAPSTTAARTGASPRWTCSPRARPARRCSLNC